MTESRLCQILEVLPASSVDCEREFSTMNDIKTFDRNKLKTLHLGDLMRVSILDIDIEILKKKHSETLIREWRYLKDRRTLS